MNIQLKKKKDIGEGNSFSESLGIYKKGGGVQVRVIVKTNCVRNGEGSWFKRTMSQKTWMKTLKS